jgi:methionyl-tRNA formyltransferase
MLAHAVRRIAPDETSTAVEQSLAQIGARLLIDTVQRLAEGPVVESPQDDRLATYAPRLTKADSRIDWSRPAAHVHNQVRGLHPWPHADAILGGARLILLKTRPEHEPMGRSAGVGTADESPAGMHGQPGEILVAEGDDLLVAAGDGSVLRILEIQPEGRRPMRVREFLASRRGLAGQRFA